MADAVGGWRPGAGDRYFFIINIDAQDERDESFLHEKPAPADDRVRICGCSGLQASRFLKNPVHPVHRCK